jgi:uncharacterized protein YegL
MMERPGGRLARRVLHFFFLLDCSGSMSVGGKIEALNNAIREALPHMRRVAADNPNAEVLVRALSFSDGARWVVGEPAPVERFTWTDVTAGGLTDLGAALLLMADQLRMPPMEARALPPVIVLVSDGRPTDDFEGGLEALLREPWGQRAVKVAVAIGRDADYQVLQSFIGDPSIQPVSAHSPEDLVRHIRWASTVVVQSVSSIAASDPEASLLPPTPAASGAAAAMAEGLTW